MTEDYLQLALKCRQELDMVNSLKYFELTTDAFLANVREEQDKSIQKGIPAFFSSFMPKSAGTYLHNSLIQMGAHEMYHSTQSLSQRIRVRCI